MFDLIELDHVETALRRLATGDTRPAFRTVDPAPADHPKGDISRCPFHNGALAQSKIAA